MKKILFLSGVALFLAVAVVTGSGNLLRVGYERELFALKNAKALAENADDSLMGFCLNKVNACIDRCPGCGELIYANTIEKGPSGGVMGLCAECLADDSTAVAFWR